MPRALARALGRLAEHRGWILLAGCAVGAAGFLAAYHLRGTEATVRLAIGEAPAPAQPSASVPRDPPRFALKLAEHLCSPESRTRVAAAAGLPGGGGFLDGHSRVAAGAAGGTLEIRVRSTEPGLSLRLAECYGREALTQAKAFWEEDCRAQQAALARQMTAVESGLERVKAELTALQSTNGTFDAAREFATGLEQRSALEAKAAQLGAQQEAGAARRRLLEEELRKQDPALAPAREALAQALTRFTEEHPKVRALRSTLAQLEAGATNTPALGALDLPVPAASPAAALQLQLVELKAQGAALEKEAAVLAAARQDLARRLRELSARDPEFARLNARHQALRESRDGLLREQNALLLAASRGPAAQGVLQPARFLEGPSLPRWRAGAQGALAGGLGGALLAASAILLAGPRRRIRTREDLQGATGLRVLAALDDLKAMGRKARETWAFETLSVLKANLRQTEGRALICGFTSSSPREGKSTWIRLLADAARRQGYCVVIASHKDRKPSPARRDAPAQPSEPAPAPEPASAWSVVPVAAGPARPGPILAEPGRAPFRIGLADWIWNWQHREQFEQALRNWSMIDNLAVFVELPAYSTPAGVMMAEKVPNLVWLCGRDVADPQATAAQVETLRKSHPGLAGAVLNRPRLRRPGVFGRRALALLALAAGLLAGAGPLPAQTNPTPRLSVTGPEQMADWQRRLTLGPGDVIDVNLFGQTDSLRAGLAIGPDGRINYLQARDVMAAGLTVDELRAELEKILTKFHLAPQVVINPVSYRSKKYYLLGNVNQRGVYVLDRPTTVIEAIARARGFVNLTQGQNVAAQVELTRSFLVRKGAAGQFARVPVDFEALFQRGDLSQNVPLAPDDYLFFPSSGPQEVYVVGEVRGAGLVPYTKDLTVLGAIAARGGFGERAWKSRVLVVRGSLARPEPLVVDLDAVLQARATDMRLANRDIVYVHSKPWAKAQELLERAALTFVDSMVMGAVNRYVIPYGSK